MSATLILASRLDSPAAEGLSRDLLAARGAAMVINAEAVTFCGALAMQLLLSARKQWQEDGQPFEIEKPSADLTDACRVLGVAPDLVGITQKTGETS